RVKTGPVEWDRAAASAPAALLDRVLPSFATSTAAAGGAVLRWVTGLERPVRYLGAGGEPVDAGALSALGLTRGGLHERALANLRRAIPPGFAPGDDPAVLDDDGAAILALPDLVPADDAWIAFPLAGEGLVVMREGAPSTRAELARLKDAAAGAAPLFERPVRVTRRGFEPFEWPSGRATDPGYGVPDDRGGTP